MTTLTTDIRRLYILLCGFEIIPKVISTKDRGEKIVISAPICSYLLDTAQGWVLLDCGLNEEILRDPVMVKRCYHDRGMTMLPVVWPCHEIGRQLAEIGIGFEDIGHVILSHLHQDHSGALRHLRHARISIQRREYDFAVSEAAGYAYFREDYLIDGLNWDFQTGDWRAMPGLELLDTAGHTPGHQSALITLPGSGSIVLPFDAGDLRENFDEEILPGECSDEAAALAGIRRLKALTEEKGATMILFHDPVEIQSLRLAPDWYG